MKKRVRAWAPKATSAKRAKSAGPSASRSIMSLRPSVRRVFPTKKQFRTQLRYFGNFIGLNPGIGGIAASHVFSANGLYDPDITGGGHQPIGFDEYMALYDHYTVIGAKIRVYFNNTDGSNPQFGTVTVRDRATVSTDTREIVENGYVAMCNLAQSGTGGDKGQVATSVDIAKFLGRTNVLADSQLKGTSAANPTEQAYFHVSGFPADQVDAGSITATVVIDYDVMFHEKGVTLPS